MKKLIIASLLGLASAPVFAQWTLPGMNTGTSAGANIVNYVGPVTFISNGGVNGRSLYTDSTIYTAPVPTTAGPAAVDAVGLPQITPVAPRNVGAGAGLREDTWGIGYISTIVVGGANNNLGLAPGTPLWTAAGNPVELTFTYYGLVDGKVSLAADGTGRTASEPLSSGAFIDVYYDFAKNFNPAGGPAARGGGAGNLPLNAANVSYPTVTDGTLWLSTAFQTGVDSFVIQAPAEPASVLNGVVAGSSPFRGNDDGYLSIASSPLGTGVDNQLFATNGIPTDLPGIFRGFSFDTPVEAQNILFGWTADNFNKSLTINTYAVQQVPEPATIATNILVVLGAGLGAWRYRSRKV